MSLSSKAPAKKKGMNKEAQQCSLTGLMLCEGSPMLECFLKCQSTLHKKEMHVAHFLTLPAGLTRIYAQLWKPSMMSTLGVFSKSNDSYSISRRPSVKGRYVISIKRAKQLMVIIIGL